VLAPKTSPKFFKVPETQWTY